MKQPVKYIVFIVSAGRTGTMFFGERLSEIIRGAHSVHEPDVVEGFNKATLDHIKTFGWYHMVLGRLLGKTGIRNLSRKYLAGELARGDLIDSLHRQRDGYYRSIDSDLIVESYTQWFGVLPVLPEVFEYHKVVALVRDPRTWMTSLMDYGSRFGPRDLLTNLGFRHLDPKSFGDPQYIGSWANMSAFERNCWHWKTICSLLRSHVLASPNARMFRYEDLFLAESRLDHFRDMLEFMTLFPGRRFSYRLDAAILERQSNASKKGRFPDWRAWDKHRARYMHDMCGPLMAEFDYGTEPEWLELVG